MSDWFLHHHLAEVLDARLPAFKTVPQDIILAAADGDASHSRLKQRYPKAAFREYDARADYLAAALAIRKQGQSLWQKLGGRLPPQYPLTRLPEDQRADMLWSNLGLLAETDLPAAFARWAAALKADGLLFFTHLGPDSLRELKAWWQRHGIDMAAPHLADMHDLGDMLPANGFYDPVMDMDTLTLHYQSAERLLADLDHLGLWPLLQLSGPERARAVLQQGFAEGALGNITLELIYGHALKKLRLPESETVVQFYPRKAGA